MSSVARHGTPPATQRTTVESSFVCWSRDVSAHFLPPTITLGARSIGDGKPNQPREMKQRHIPRQAMLVPHPKTSHACATSLNLLPVPRTSFLWRCLIRRAESVRSINCPPAPRRYLHVVLLQPRALHASEQPVPLQPTLELCVTSEQLGIECADQTLQLSDDAPAEHLTVPGHSPFSVCTIKGQDSFLATQA